MVSQVESSKLHVADTVIDSQLWVQFLDSRRAGPATALLLVLLLPSQCSSLPGFIGWIQIMPKYSGQATAMVLLLGILQNIIGWKLGSQYSIVVNGEILKRKV